MGNCKCAVPTGDTRLADVASVGEGEELEVLAESPVRNCLLWKVFHWSSITVIYITSTYLHNVLAQDGLYTLY